MSTDNPIITAMKAGSPYSPEDIIDGAISDCTVIVTDFEQRVTAILRQATRELDEALNNVLADIKFIEAWKQEFSKAKNLDQVEAPVEPKANVICPRCQQGYAYISEQAVTIDEHGICLSCALPDPDIEVDLVQMVERGKVRQITMGGNDGA